MDLRQKHANLSEAREARKQTVETGRQGNTIMVFTIVTILFVRMPSGVCLYCAKVLKATSFVHGLIFRASY